jgi:hypothetical protein
MAGHVELCSKRHIFISTTPLNYYDELSLSQ